MVMYGENEKNDSGNKCNQYFVTNVSFSYSRKKQNQGEKQNQKEKYVYAKTFLSYARKLKDKSDHNFIKTGRSVEEVDKNCSASLYKKKKYILKDEGGGGEGGTAGESHQEKKKPIVILNFWKMKDYRTDKKKTDKYELQKNK